MAGPANPPDQDEANRYDRLNSIFISVLLGSGFVLGLNRVIAVGWAESGLLDIQEILALLLVYVSAVASALAVARKATQFSPLLFELYSINLAIMFVYLIQFAFFVLVWFVMLLMAINFGLYILYDLVRAKGRVKGRTGPAYWVHGRDRATGYAAGAMFAIVALFEVLSSIEVRIGLLILAVVLTLLYRLKLKDFFGRRSLESVATTV